MKLIINFCFTGFIIFVILIFYGSGIIRHDREVFEFCQANGEYYFEDHGYRSGKKITCEVVE